MNALPIVHGLRADDITTINGEPRVMDLRLAEALGFSYSYDIRKLIRSHEGALAELGEVFATVAKTSEQGGRPSTVYHLNEGQAVYLCMKSETPKATAVTLALVRLFLAVKKGDHASARERMLEAELLKARPRWGRIIDLRRKGLAAFEIRRVLKISRSTFNRNYDAMAGCGLAPRRDGTLHVPRLPDPRQIALI